MGWMNNFKKKISGMPQDDAANEGYDYNGTTPEYYAAAQEYNASAPSQQGGSSMELKMVSPTQFSEMPAIARDLMNSRTIVINMEKTSTDIMRRMMDFLSGVAFCVGGQIQPITKQTYIITPGNVDVSSEQFKAQQQPQSAQEGAQESAPTPQENAEPNPATPQKTPYGYQNTPSAPYGGFDPFGQN